MDSSDEGSDEDKKIGSNLNSFHFATKMENFPSTVNILKPQIDQIFSEVQKNLPTIDFDLSDVSSDNDEPIFFHQNLKLSELGSPFDDDKDLDTSLSQGDGPQVTGFVQDTCSIGSNSDKYTPSDKNIGSFSDDLLEDHNLALYDNDLAALLAQTSFPTDEEISKWRLLAKQMEDSEFELEAREEVDLQRSRNLGHFSTHRKTSSRNLPNIPAFSDQELHTKSVKNNSQNKVGFKTDMLQNVTCSEDHLEDNMQEKRRRNFKEETRIKDEEIMSKLTPQEPTLLSLHLFEKIDLDSVLNAANEENIPLASLRLVGKPVPSQMPRNLEGSGDSKERCDIGEELTMIQKLAQLSIQQGGSHPAIVNGVDPHTGASVDHLIINQEKTTMLQVSTKTSGTDCTILKPATTQAENMDSGSQTPGTKKSSSGTNTATRVDRAKILYGRLRHEKKKDNEPPTIFIDLRGFEKKKEEEKQGLRSVQRVLGLQNAVQESDSSSDEEMVERCDWRKTRKQIKEDLSAHGASATLHTEDKDGSGREAEQNKPKYKRPPRVINLQKHEVSKRWARPPETLVEEEGEREMNKQEDEDNKVRMEKLEAEREKERQREAAKKLREQREKERERRMRMSQQIEAARSTATTQGRQSAGENTPTLFDMEVSYEPAPTMLPTILSPDRDTVLLTVHLSSNGEIIKHRNRSSRSVDTGEGLSATYTALLSWLLSLVPHDFTFLDSTSSTPPQCQGPIFHVLGLQQMWSEEELKLHVVITPAPRFQNESKKLPRSKKYKQRDDVKGSSQFAQQMSKLLTTNTLHDVCPWLDMLTSVTVKSEQAEDKNAPQYAYTPPLPKISTKPLSTFVQVNPDPQAARKIFNIPVGLYWQTVDNDESWCDIECHDDNVNYETQNTMALIYKKIYHNPLALMSILNRSSQEGLDLSGVRLVYPCAEQMNIQGLDAPSSDLENLNRVGPVLALALRGTFARTIWLDAVGPSDPELARRTDPKSLCAQFGGESRENVLLFCPRNLSRVQSELTRWFGGRIPKAVSTLDVGVPYVRREEVKGKKGKKLNPADQHSATHRPPAALTATCRADIFLVLSPLVPPSYIGVVMATAQRRGYQVRGVKRLCLSCKGASSLGIGSDMLACFCPGAKTDDIGDFRPQEAIAPCTVFLLRKENAAHNAASLIEAFMVQLTLAGLLGCVQMRLDDHLISQHLFHTALFTDCLHRLLGDFAKIPEFDMSHLRLKSSISTRSGKDMEQMAVVILLGHDMLKKCGFEVGKILNVLPYSSKSPVQSVLTERYELLAIKWTPSLSMHQAKELTPYEVGDMRWKQSLRLLASEPALVLVLRGVNIFQRLRPLVEQQDDEDSQSKMYGNSASKKEKSLRRIMSHNSSESDMFTRLFFYHNELFPDPLSRALLPYVPESRLYFNIVERTENSERIRLFTLKPLEELNLTVERVIDEIEGGQQPITTLMLVKPGAVEKYLHRILKKIVQEKFEIVGLRMLVLDLDAAELFVPAAQNKINTERLKFIEAMTSGPSVALALCHENAVKKLCDLVGPEEPMAARRQNQFLWRGEFGRDAYQNGIYCSGLYVDAVRDLKLMFPDGLCCEVNELLIQEQISAPGDDSVIDVSTRLQREIHSTRRTHTGLAGVDLAIEEAHHMLVQTTCLVLTPPLIKTRSRSKDVAGVGIIAYLMANGFHLVGARLVWLTEQQAECLLYIRGGGNLAQARFLSSGPCLVLAAERDNAVLAFDSLLSQSSEGIHLIKEYGPLILRAQTIQQSNNLLAFFFDHLMPDSQLTVRPRSDRPLPSTDHSTDSARPLRTPPTGVSGVETSHVVPCEDAVNHHHQTPATD